SRTRSVPALSVQGPPEASRPDGYAVRVRGSGGRTPGGGPAAGDRADHGPARGRRGTQQRPTDRPDTQTGDGLRTGRDIGGRRLLVAVRWVEEGGRPVDAGRLPLRPGPLPRRRVVRKEQRLLLDVCGLLLSRIQGRT